MFDLYNLAHLYNSLVSLSIFLGVCCTFYTGCQISDIKGHICSYGRHFYRLNNPPFMMDH